QPGACVEGGRRIGGAHRGGSRGRRRPRGRPARRWGLCTSHGRGFGGSGPLSRPPRVCSGRRPLPPPPRGGPNELLRHPRASHLDPYDLGREKTWRPGQSGGRRACPLRGAGHGAQDVKDGLKTISYAEGKGFLSPVEEIIEDLRNGRMIILVDAEDRENEGDLVIPAQM